MVAEPLWRLEIVGGCGDSPNSDGCEWHAVKSTVRLIHVTTGQALKMTGKQLPKWGFNQHEIVTDRIVVQDDTVWNVEEHRYTKSQLMSCFIELRVYSEVKIHLNINFLLSF
jgi:dolichyl-phosphate-mannose-protein mannosyltransferase